MKIAALLSKISQFVFDIMFFIVLFKIIIDQLLFLCTIITFVFGVK